MPRVRNGMGPCLATGDGMNNAIWGTIIFSIITLSWASLAAYVGMTAFLATLSRQPRLGVFIFTSATILIPTITFLSDQYWFIWLDQFRLDFSDDRTFATGRFILNACFYSGMVMSLLSGRYLPHPLRRPIRLTCLWALAFATLWAVGPGGIFMSMLFVPDSDLLGSRLIFVVAFLAISMGAFWRLSAICKTQRN